MHSNRSSASAFERFGALLFLVVGATVPGRAPAVSVETFVIAVGGQSQVGPGLTCTTFGPASPGIAFFANATPGVPIDGLGPCGVAGLFRTTTLASDGPLSDATSLSTAFAENTFAGNSLALARTGSVLAEAHATFTGPSNSQTVEGAAAYGVATDRLTATSPSVAAGAPGSIRLRFTVDGALSIAGPTPVGGTADVEINYSVAGGPSFVLMRAQASRSDVVPFAITGTGAPLTGFNLEPGSFSGVGEVGSLALPIIWGSPFDFKFGVLTGAIPGTGATADVDFTRGATLTGIELFANGVPVQDFSIASESGTAYGANGVPEPLSGVMLAAGVLLLGVVHRRGRFACAGSRAPVHRR